MNSDNKNPISFCSSSRNINSCYMRRKIYVSFIKHKSHSAEVVVYFCFSALSEQIVSNEFIMQRSNRRRKPGL